RRVLSHRALVFVGLISYPLYLWHWPILSFMTIIESDTPPSYMRAAAVIVSLGLALLTYRMVELPIRSGRGWKLSGWRLSGALVGATATAGLAGLLVFAQHGFPSRFDRPVTAIHSGPKEDALCRRSIAEAQESNFCRRTSPQPPEVV